MTSEPDSTPRRRPPTIDLTAKEVETGQGASAQESAAADPAIDRVAEGNSSGGRGGWNFASGAKPYAVGAVVGAIAVGAIIAAIRIAGFAPARETAVALSAQGAKTPGADEISSRLDKIQEALQAPRPNEALATRIAAAEAQTKSLGDQLGALTRRVDDVAAASQNALAQGKAAVAAAEGAKTAAQTGVQRHDVDALNNRIATLESSVKSLAAEVTKRTSSADDRVARATVAAEALRAAVERGAPYQAELEAVKSFGADQNATDPLAPFAAVGVPSAAALGRELTALTAALQRASGGAPNDGSFLGRLEAHAQNLVRVTPIDAPSAPSGDDPSALVAQINGDAARGDIAGALAGIARLPDAARAVAETWVKKAEAREAAIAASRRIATDALAALGRPASQ
jgi:hypothetical protein